VLGGRHNAPGGAGGGALPLGEYPVAVGGAVFSKSLVRAIITAAQENISLRDWAPLPAMSCDSRQSALGAVFAVTQAIVGEIRARSAQRGWQCARHEMCLLLGYLTLSELDGDWVDRAAAEIADYAPPPGDVADGVASSLRPRVSRFGLFDGLCGPSWVAQHLSALADAEDADRIRAAKTGLGAADPVNSEIDAVVLAELGQGRWRGSYELAGGLTGVGLYFLERLPARAAVQGIGLVLDHLEDLAEATDLGLTWRTAPEKLPDWERAICPSGNHNLSVPHGVPGVAGFLNEVCAAGLGEARAEHLLEGAIAWLLAHGRPDGSLSRFGLFVPDDHSLQPGFGWCYADLGILLILLRSARRTGRSDWQRFADDLLEHCLAWPPDLSGVCDSSLYYGAAGVGHAFNRIYHDGGDARCSATAVAWLEWALSMRCQSGGVGGFTSMRRTHTGDPPMPVLNPALLDGAIEVALALLAAITPVEPGWDRMMLLSGRTPTAWEGDCFQRARTDGCH
jgi:lantibiotic biosynthesis protein